jgi:hypothetical protein
VGFSSKTCFSCFLGGGIQFGSGGCHTSSGDQELKDMEEDGVRGASREMKWKERSYTSVVVILPTTI